MINSYNNILFNLLKKKKQISLNKFIYKNTNMSVNLMNKIKFYFYFDITYLFTLNLNILYLIVNYKNILKKSLISFYNIKAENKYLFFYSYVLNKYSVKPKIMVNNRVLKNKIVHSFSNNVKYNIYINFKYNNFNSFYSMIYNKKLLKFKSHENSTHLNFFYIDSKYNFNKTYNHNEYLFEFFKSINLKKLNNFKNHIYFNINYYFNIFIPSYFFENTQFLHSSLLFINYKINFLPTFKYNNYLINVKHNLNIDSFKNYLLFVSDFYNVNFFKKNINIFSNKYLIKYIGFYDDSIFNIINLASVKNTLVRSKNYNNYYPIILFDYKIYNIFFKKFSQNYNSNFVQFNNKLLINFFESAFKKNFFIKVTNNNFNKLTNYYYYRLIHEYKNFQPLYLKKFLILDFIEIIWYSFLLRDLTMLSEWITKLMEGLNFKNHKKFLSFFQNFLNKFSGLFLDALSVRGFLFDIRGKVGVTGSSKKRHFCYKFGSIKKSSKDFKINFNQGLVRTYSGVMGLTYILCY